MITREGVEARLPRLERLSAGLAKELVVIGEAQDPLLYIERRAYLAAVQGMLAGAERARVELSRALHRMRRGPGPD